MMRLVMQKLLTHAAAAVAGAGGDARGRCAAGEDAGAADDGPHADVGDGNDTDDHGYHEHADAKCRLYATMRTILMT